MPILRHEHPVIRLDGRYSVGFTFATRLHAASSQRLGIRIPALREHLLSTDPLLFDALVEPGLSFFRDIVNPAFERRGMPLILAVEPVESRTEDRFISVQRPERTFYAAEGNQITLERGVDHDLQVRLGFRDAVAIFDSGHIFYQLSLISEGAEGTIDEYWLLNLQKLVDPSEATQSLREQIIFRWGKTPPGTLVDFVQRRWELLENRAGNCVSEVLKPLLVRDERLPAPDWRALRFGSIFLESASLHRVLLEVLDADEEQSPTGDVTGRAAVSSGNGEPPASWRALAGVLQNVLDYESQDLVEVRESIEPLQIGEGFAILGHPRFTFELCDESRSFQAMLGCLGVCPYFLLPHLVVGYNEVLLAEAESHLEELEYGDVSSDVLRSQSHQTLASTFEASSGIVLPRMRVALQTNVELRLRVFRDLIARFLPNIFRYSTERGVYDKLSRDRGLVVRHDRAYALMNDYKALVRDMHDLAHAESTRRTNEVLVALALIGTAGVLLQLTEASPAAAVARGVAVVISAGVLLILMRWSFRQFWTRRRSRQSTS